MRRLQLLLGMSLALLVSACGNAAPSAAPQPDLRIGLSPAAGALRPALLACIHADAADQFSIESTLPGNADLADYAVLIQLDQGGSLPTFAVQLGSQRLVAIVNAANNLRQLSREQLAAVFSGRITDWAELDGPAGPIEVWIPLDGDEARDIFRAEVLLGSEYRGDAHLAADTASMQAATAGDSGAIGLLPASLVTEALRGIETGVEAPVLALATDTPDDALQATLACLQARED